MSKHLILCFFAAITQLSLQASLPSDSYYTAGVVEFEFSIYPTSKLRLLENLNGYLKLIASKEANETDILIFPESTLNSNEEATFVPDPNIGRIVPCDEDPSAKIYHEFFVKLSCQAKNHKRYLVINVSEKEICSLQTDDPRPCASNDLNIFNTNVVFDRSGAVISRYRKVHLYGENNKNTTYVPVMGIFDTDFGVRFGHFICFDILFYSPAQEMSDKNHVHDFIFPTMWFSQLPFLTGVQFQHSWSFGNDVNLLAAGSSFPKVGTTGSGIYNGRRGTLISVVNREKGQKTVLVARVPKYVDTANRRSNRSTDKLMKLLTEIPSEALLDDIKLKRDSVQNYTSVILDLNAGNSTQREICHNKYFCCKFDLVWKKHVNVSKNSQYYTYRLAAYDGPRNEASVEENYLRNCAIFSCTSDDIMDCGKIFSRTTEKVIEPQVTFTRISVEAKYPNSEEYLLMPNTLLDDLIPLEPEQFVWQVEDNTNFQNVNFSLKDSISNILTFAIYGNYYDNKGTAEIETAGAMTIITNNILFISILFCLNLVL